MVPATNAVIDRLASVLRRLKTYLRTTMSQERLNHCKVLHVQKEMTDKLNKANNGNQFFQYQMTDKIALEIRFQLKPSHTHVLNTKIH